MLLKEDSMPTSNLTDDIKKRAGWSVFMGVLTAILGLFLIAYPLATATITTVLFGWVLIFVGIAQFVFALHSKTIGTFFWKVLLGALYGIAGVALAFVPLGGVAALTVILGTLLLVYAGVDAAIAFQMRPAEGWGWFLFDAVIAFLMGVLILARWPSSSIWAIGTLVGVSVLISGISRIMIAGKIRNVVARIERPRAA
jgi:uncharacterized membrane protein HdeD (DUF308 family)